MEFQKQMRNENVSEVDLKEVLAKLLEMQTKLISETSSFIKIERIDGRLFTTDYYISAIVNRAISLINGFSLLSQNNNYIAAVPMIRMQLDNLMRLYAATIVEDSDKFFVKYLSGEHIRNMKDATGQRMTDDYLIKQIDQKLYLGVHELYRNTSGYIHLSHDHSFVQTEIIDQNKYSMSTKIGMFDFFKIDQKVDFAFNMYIVTNYLYRLICGWTLHKKNFIQNNNKSTS